MVDKLLFQVLTEREERIRWPCRRRLQRQLLRLDQNPHRPRLCVAIVDRLRFGGNIIETGTDSYRLAPKPEPQPLARLRLVKPTFYVLLWSQPGMDEALVAYEEAVLALVGEHDGNVVSRARSDGRDGRPLEIQLFEWASQTAMDGFMSDPRRTALAGDRDRAIARTEIIPVQFI